MTSICQKINAYKLLEVSEKLEKIVKYSLQMICYALRDLVLITFWRLNDSLNTY